MINTENPSFMRDLDSKALINTDKQKFNARIAAKQRDARIAKLETDFSTVINELSDIKELLSQIVNRK